MGEIALISFPAPIEPSVLLTHFSLFKKGKKMKKITLALLVASALFAESEDFYKAKYDYLNEKFKVAHDNCFTATLKAGAIHFSYEGYTRADQRRDEENKRDYCNNEDDTKEKLMELKFNVIENLKSKPEWFTFGDKK